MRAKNLRVAYCQSWKGHDYTQQKRWDRNLDDYKAARKQGIEPRSSWPKDVAQAVQDSNETGEAFKGR